MTVFKTFTRLYLGDAPFAISTPFKNSVDAFEAVASIQTVDNMIFIVGNPPSVIIRQNYPFSVGEM